MRIFSVIAYLISAICLYMAMLITWGTNNVNIINFWDLSSMALIIASFFLSTVNFKFSEIFRAVRSAISSSNSSYENLVFSKKVIQSTWNNLFNMSLFAMLAVSIIICANAELSKLGHSLGIMLIITLYALLLRLFIFMPLEISLEKKIIISGQQKISGQAV